MTSTVTPFALIGIPQYQTSKCRYKPKETFLESLLEYSARFQTRDKRLKCLLTYQTDSDHQVLPASLSPYLLQGPPIFFTLFGRSSLGQPLGLKLALWVGGSSHAIPPSFSLYDKLSLAMSLWTFLYVSVSAASWVLPDFYSKPSPLSDTQEQVCLPIHLFFSFPQQNRVCQKQDFLS